MRDLLLSKVFVVTMTAGILACPAPSSATVLLHLIDPAAGSTDYNLSFTATDTETTLSVAGFDLISAEVVDLNTVSTGGGPNLLGSSWIFIPAASGSSAFTFDDGTSVPGLIFAGSSAGFYDTFSQTFATTPGVTYDYSFTFTEGEEGESELLVTATASSAAPVPEPSTWAMMIIGFAALGYAGYRVTHRTAVAAS